MKIRELLETPDFGYTTFINRDEDLNKLEWTIEYPFKDAVQLIASETKNSKDQMKFDFAPEKYRVAQIGLELQKEDGKYFRAIVRQSNVSPEWTGTGLGQIMYDKAIVYAKKKGCRYFRSDAGGNRSIDADRAWKKIAKRYPVESHGNFYVIDLDKV